MGAVFANYSDSADRRGGPGREENVGVTLFPSAVPERTRALAKWPIFPPGVYFPPAEGLPGDPLSKNSAFPVSSYLAHTASTLRTMLPAVKARTIVISWKAMAEDPVRHQYHPNNRAELFDFLRASLPAADSARLIEQWAWRYEASPFNPPEGPTVDIIRIGSKLVALVAGFRVRMSMGGIECLGESRGVWLVHPEHRGHHLWRRVGTLQSPDTPILFGWSRIPGLAAAEDRWVAEPVTPLLRVVDPGPLIERFTNSRWLSSIGAGASTAARVAGAPFRRARGVHNHSVVRLSSFDNRVDALFDRARSIHLAMVVRDHRYLNWRYCQRPDATYMLFGVERGSELAAFLVARSGARQGVPWGYIVDFLAPANSREVLSSLIDQALDEFRLIGVAAVVCFATDPMVRRTLFRHGFFPVPQRKPMHFNRSILAERTDLAKFAALRNWSVTMGDGDLEMAP